MIKYNIYYRPTSRPDWIKSNPEPLNHNPEGNVYVIPSLAEGVTYAVAIVAGIVQNSRFVPLMRQPLTPADIGAGDINIVENFPRYLVKTLRS